MCPYYRIGLLIQSSRGLIRYVHVFELGCPSQTMSSSVKFLERRFKILRAPLGPRYHIACSTSSCTYYHLPKVTCNSGGTCHAVEVRENNIMKYLHQFWTRFEHEIAPGGGGGDSGGFILHRIAKSSFPLPVAL